MKTIQGITECTPTVSLTNCHSCSNQHPKPPTLITFIPQECGILPGKGCQGHMGHGTCSHTSAPMFLFCLCVFVFRTVRAQNIQRSHVSLTCTIHSGERIKCIFFWCLCKKKKKKRQLVVSKQRWAAAPLIGRDPVSGCESETRAQVQLGLMGSQTSSFLQSGAKK